jgi:hypothetical protein
MKSIKHSIVKTKVFCLLSFSVAVLCLFSCKKEQPAMRSLEEDCDCAKEVSAEFKTGQYTNAPFSDEFIETDTIHFYVDYQDGNPINFSINQTSVSFIADIENAISYKWQVGNNATQQTTRSFTLTFDDTLGTIPVTLIVHAKPNLICNPNDDGYDTIKKFLTLKSFKDFPLKGKYEGYASNDPLTKFTVEIDTFKKAQSWIMVSYGIKNLPNGQNIFNYLGNMKTYSILGMSDGQDTPDDFYVVYPYKGENQQHTPIVYDRKTKTITIKYSYEYRGISPYQRFEKITFTGKKL